MHNNTHLWTRASVALIAAATAAIALPGCSEHEATAEPAPLTDKVYSVTPSSLTVKSGIVSGEVTDMKVVEQRAEDGSVATPAVLTGKIVLKNISADQSVRFLEGKISYVDAQGKAIALEDDRTEPVLKLSAGYGTPERLDPGENTSQSIEAQFPAAALKEKRLKNIRVELTYIPTPYREQALSFPVSIGSPPQVQAAAD